MILILSKNFESATDLTIDWLNVSFIRINENAPISSILVTTDKIECKFMQIGSVVFNEISCFWYRRGDFILLLNSLRDTFNSEIKKNLNTEWENLKEYLHFFLLQKKSFGSFFREKYHNKLRTLFLANIVGLIIPNTLVSGKRSILNDFIQNSESITKSIDNMFTTKGQMVDTKLVTQNKVSGLTEYSFPTLLQKKIEKAFELRIFYMRNQFYPMAIFSQTDKQTQLDYRNYNRVKPNRNIPYILPKDIETKLQKLMDRLDLDTGSIDMIVTPEGEYVFLEVNPTGQFGWVSENCNYYLEEKIANYLQYES